MITVKQLEELKAAGKIRGWNADVKKPATDKGKVASKKKAQKYKDWITLNLEHWCKANRLEMKLEFQFYPDRKWRTDWAIPAIKVAIEYEGISGRKNGHTSKQGYTGNTEKYNALASQGWRLFRYTSLNYESLFNDLNKLL